MKKNQSPIPEVTRAEGEKHMKYLNKKAAELFSGEKVTYRGFVYWANMTRKEIYRHSVEAEISGVTNGTKYANITDDWKIVK